MNGTVMALFHWFLSWIIVTRKLLEILSKALTVGVLPKQILLLLPGKGIVYESNLLENLLLLVN